MKRKIRIKIGIQKIVIKKEKIVVKKEKIVVKRVLEKIVVEIR